MQTIKEIDERIKDYKKNRMKYNRFQALAKISILKRQKEILEGVLNYIKKDIKEYEKIKYNQKGYAEARICLRYLYNLEEDIRGEKK